MKDTVEVPIKWIEGLLTINNKAQTSPSLWSSKLNGYVDSAKGFLPKQEI